MTEQEIRKRLAAYIRGPFPNDHDDFRPTTEGVTLRCVGCKELRLPLGMERICSRCWRLVAAALEPVAADVKIATPCPSCGSQTLTLDDKGRLYCTLIGCKEPVTSLAVEKLRNAPAEPTNLAFRCPRCGDSVVAFLPSQEEPAPADDEKKKQARIWDLEGRLVRIANHCEQNAVICEKQDNFIDAEVWRYVSQMTGQSTAPAASSCVLTAGQLKADLRESVNDDSAVVTATEPPPSDGARRVTRLHYEPGVRPPADDHFKGRIENVRVFDHALTPEQVARIAHADDERVAKAVKEIRNLCYERDACRLGPDEFNEKASIIVKRILHDAGTGRKDEG